MTLSADRLRQARKAAGYASARAAALAMGVPVATYAQHERGVRAFTAEAQDRYHAFFHATPFARPQKAVSAPPGAV